jgi:nucleotide-binding universal stress UspA family protein
MYKKILVPLDGSLLAESVLLHAQALAKSEDAEMLSSVCRPTRRRSILPQPLPRQIRSLRIWRETDKYLQDEVRKLSKEGYKVSSLIFCRASA